MEILGIGFLSALGFFILMAKINLDFFVKYQWQTDLAVSALLAVLFFGTFSGMATALVAGIFMSLFLYISKLIINN